MKNFTACALLAFAGCAFCLPSQAQALPPELGSAVPAATFAGQAKLTFFGFSVYQATLWVAPGFVEAAYARSPFALELVYLRDFTGRDIAKRSITEMQRQVSMTAEQQALWESQMRALFPDVVAGDRITGVNQPGSGAVFWRNGRLLGEVHDPVFAKLFFGIWLAEKTSEPQLRRALLAQANPAAQPHTP
jgi:hypothetical protein